MWALLMKKNNLGLLLFAICEAVSASWGNYLMVGALLIAAYAWSQELIPLAKAYRGYYLSLGIFYLTMLLSAAGSGNFLHGLELAGEYWVWRLGSFFILTCTLQRQGGRNTLLCACVGMLLEAGLVIYQGLQGMPRPYGFQYNAMWPATLLCIFTPLFLIGFLEDKFSSLYRGGALVLFLVNSLALLLNGTRGVWLAVLLTCTASGLYYCWRRRRNILYCLALVLVIGGYALSNQYYIDRFRSISDTQASSAYCRICLWKSSTQMFLEHPLLGVGLGNYLQVYEAGYMQPDVPNKHLTHAHSNIFQMLGENGLVGLLGFGSFFGYILWRNWLRLRQDGNVYALMVVAMTTSFLLQGLTDYNFIIDIGVKYYALLLGCLLLLQQPREKID